MTLDRREFLRAALLGAAGIALGACTRKDPAQPLLLPTPFERLRGELQGHVSHGLQVFAGGQVFLPGSDVRLPLGLADNQGTSIEASDARVWVGQAASLEGPSPLDYRRYERSAPGDPRGFHVTSASIPWTGLVDVLVVVGTLYGTTTINVETRSPSPEPGDRAIPVATPTIGALRGVKNLCTRVPACSMHDERLDLVLGNGKPVVFSISSPKLCSSRTCGPVVDEILSLQTRHRARAHFIHAEVYKGDEPTILSPTSQAWNLKSDPWTWVIDGAGIVRTRFEGPVVAAEIESALERLLR